MVETKGLEPLGGHVLIKGTEVLYTSGGVYIPNSGQKSPDTYNREFIVCKLGDGVAQEVKDKLAPGDKVFVNWIPTMHPAIVKEETKEKFDFWFICEPNAIKCKITDQ